MRVRVRGIYSTAITKILLDKGIKVSHTSKIIRERLGIDESNEPPTVTVKDTEDKHAVLIVGEYNHGKRVYEILKNYSQIQWKSKLPLHAIVKGRIIDVKDDRSIVDIGNFKGIVDERLEVGEELLFDVARPFMPNDNYAKLSTKYTVFGKYVALVKGIERKVIFSRHINKKLREDLIALSRLSDVKEWCIRWRSSAVLGKIEDMLRDIEETYKKALNIIEAGKNADVGEVVYDGEFFAILYLDKFLCDEIRNEIKPTIKYHHSLKSLDETEIVDFSECLLERYGNRNDISEIAMNYILSKMCEQKLVKIEHISALKGEVVRLTPGKPLNNYSLKRVFRRAGIFDGLNVKKEPGDYDIMEFLPNAPFILHKYYGRDGNLKGIYVNLNTPPDISRNRIRYVDMEVDVVAGEEVRVIDVDKLERACELGILSESIRDYCLNLAERIKNCLESREEICIHDLAKTL